ncbi:MAG TPA: methyltransferase domain-containing protein, partial [Candidatus Binatia bacterium]|nr:methyltransferase domain-containing protein [Candidatus Binatia bacterium]
MAAQQHTSVPQILDRRTLARDHRRLAALLRPGMRVLDVGCGTGAITSGIARVVGPSGLAVGIDRDPGLLRLARQQHANLASLRFEERDVFDLRPDPVFDIVTAARVVSFHAAFDVRFVPEEFRSEGDQVVVLGTLDGTTREGRRTDQPAVRPRPDRPRPPSPATALLHGYRDPRPRPRRGPP